MEKENGYQARERQRESAECGRSGYQEWEKEGVLLPKVDRNTNPAGE